MIKFQLIKKLIEITCAVITKAQHYNIDDSNERRNSNI